LEELEEDQLEAAQVAQASPTSTQIGFAGLADDVKGKSVPDKVAPFENKAPESKNPTMGKS
jgi:hypothetical protein